MCVEHYIKQVVRFPLYSQPFAKKMVPNAVGDLSLDIDYTPQGAKLILVKSFIIQNSGAAVVHELVDKFDRVLYAGLGSIGAMSGQYVVDHIINSSRLFLVFTNSAAKAVNVTVHYQFIYPQDQKDISRFPDGNTRP